MSFVFEQGELVELDFTPSVGHEPIKRRSALVVSANRFNAVISSLTVVCPITSTDNGHLMHIPMDKQNVVRGFICVEQLRSVDMKQRKARSLEAFADTDTMARVLELIGAVFNI